MSLRSDNKLVLFLHLFCDQKKWNLFISAFFVFIFLL